MSDLVRANGTSNIRFQTGAHGRFIPKATGQSQREARIQTLEPEPWMFEVEKKGHATRKCVVQSPENV